MTTRAIFSNRLRRRASAALSLLRAALLEIFDESAYARFLTRTRLASSPSSYAAFLREQEAAKSRRPKCC